MAPTQEKAVCYAKKTHQDSTVNKHQLLGNDT